MAGRKSLAAVSLAAALLAAVPAWANDKTWTGAGGTSWATAGSWSPAGMPTGNDRAIIPNVANDPIVGANTLVGQLVLQPGSIVTINNGFTLTVQGVSNGVPASPVIDGTGTVARVGAAGTGILAVTGGMANGVVVNDSAALPNFILNAPGFQLGIASNKTVTINGNATIQAGTLHLGATAGLPSTLQVNGGVTIFAAGTFNFRAGASTLRVTGGLSVTGGWLPGTGSVVMAGTGTITGAIPTLAFNTLLVDGAVTDMVTAAKSFTVNGTFQVNQGALTTSGAITMTAAAGMSVGNGVGVAGSADLHLVGPGALAMGPGQPFSVNGTDGRLTSLPGGGANPALTGSGGPCTVNGQANLFGLNFSSGNANGLNFGASATIERLRNVRFSGVNAAAGARHLTISSAGLDLDAPGCMFDTLAVGQFNVWAVDTTPGNGIPVLLRLEDRTGSNGAGAIGGPGAGEAFDGDDDTNDNGVVAAPETTAVHGGAVIQWVYTANVDMTGAIQGFPMVAFDWNTFAYYSTYVLMQNTAAFDTIYVLNANGDLKPYSYTLNIAGTRIVGPLYWDTEGAARVVYFGTDDGAGVGAVYKLIDTGTSLAPPAGVWSTPFTQGSMKDVNSWIISDRTNIYFAANRGNPNYAVWAVDIATKTQSLSPAIGLGAVRMETAPSWWTGPAGTYLFFGTISVPSAVPSGSRLMRIYTANWGNVDATFNRLSAVPPAPPDPAADQDCTADILAITNVVDRSFDTTLYLYVGEMNGYMHAVNALGTFTQVRPGFPFRDTASAILGGAVMDWTFGRLFFGNAAGSIYTLGNSAGTWTLNTNYFRFATGGGPIQTMPLYLSGVLYVSNANGRLYALDVNTGAGQALVRTWNLGTTASSNDLGDVSRDFNTSRIYVATSGGRLYSVPQLTDPTPLSQ